LYRLAIGTFCATSLCRGRRKKISDLMKKDVAAFKRPRPFTHVKSLAEGPAAAPRYAAAAAAIAAAATDAAAAAAAATMATTAPMRATATAMCAAATAAGAPASAAAPTPAAAATPTPAGAATTSSKLDAYLGRRKVFRVEYMETGEGDVGNFFIVEMSGTNRRQRLRGQSNCRRAGYCQ
jgi:uncharacterized membrane protein